MRFAPLLLSVLVLALLPASVADARPEGQVALDAPEALALTGGASTILPVQVQGRIACTAGFEAPRDLRLTLDRTGAELGDAYLWKLSPQTVLLSWRPARAEPGVFVVDETVRLQAVSDVAPAQPRHENVSVLLAADAEEVGAGRCAPDGYDVRASNVTVALTVSPDATAATADGAEEELAIAWPPVLLAVVLLAGVGAFAARRERRRSE